MLIDTHCHLTSPGLIGRIEDVIARAREAEVGRMIMVAEDPSDARTARELLGEHPELFLTAGVHPHRAGRCDRDTLAELAELLRGQGLPEDLKRRIVGIGETGIDLHYQYAPQRQQEEVLQSHLELATRLALPVVIHARKAEVRVCEILAGFPLLAGRAVFHCFSGDRAVARRVLDLGGYCSFTGVVTFRKAELIQDSARYVPIDRIMVETDAPYLSPAPLRNVRPNEPALLVHTVRCLAELRQEPFSALAAATTANATRFFRLPKEPA